jgi:hypothetical protein
MGTAADMDWKSAGAAVQRKHRILPSTLCGFLVCLSKRDLAANFNRIFHIDASQLTSSDTADRHGRSGAARRRVEW